ncbi:hypothetical protein [Botrimarina sp.]|uniref:hypothetical protein n=1 Tax=Botrimarina sp. TaxID=2795802 RepID=UPI0032EC4824
MAQTLETKLVPWVRTMQIILAGLCAGPIVFAGILLAIGSQKPENPAPLAGQQVEADGDGLIEKIALGVGVLAIFSQGVVGRVVTDAAAKAAVGENQPGESAEALAGAYQTGLIVASAINEGGAFFNLVAYMITQSPWNMAMAALLVCSNAAKFPTVAKVANWAEAKARQLSEEAALKPM